ncbi:MAG: PD-(D/E)XK nuclease family protein [Fibromonadaceae bacterium]|nr:PD-(D/E)XK nuclease family protein [Fibromonadaceae bacterium]
MNAFLHTIAKNLYLQSGTNGNLSDLTIVTPSRRTKIFMNKYFAELSGGKPLWAPKYKNLLQLFSGMNDMNLYGDPIQKISLVWELYNAYRKVLNSNENFDEFYFFGEILLGDFDDIDKALLDPKQVFRIISEHKELESFEHLDKEQIGLIQKFFNFSKDSRLQKNFFDIWNNLAAIYADFYERLLHRKIAYEGMFMRCALDNFDAQKFNSGQYIFVGFNRISKVENMLIEKLANKHIIKDDVDFNELPGGEISFIEAANPNMQTGYIGEWLKNLGNKNFENADTAIVLCDEKLLPATLSALPAEIEPNIAILYSLIQSQTANSLIREMETLAKKDVKIPQEFLLHLQEFIEKLAESKETAKPLEIVALSECHKMLNALNGIVAYMENCGVLFKLIKRLLTSIKLSYSGEPAQGLQIMAMSDTRNMDFENILMLSANDGIIPKLESESSFIPASIRKTFKLPSLAEQEAEEKYNFFRLLKRAKNVAFAYNTGKNSIGKGEMSRYLMQLLVANEKNIKRITLESDVKNETQEKEISIPKTREMIRKILSPSAFNKFINCSLQFYFEYVAGIKKPEDLTEEIDAALMGSIFHKTMELHCGKKGSDIKSLIKEAWEEKTKIPVQKLIFHVIERMAKNVIAYYEKNPAEIEAWEKKYFIEMSLKDGTKVNIGGIIDRIDKRGDTINVVDYKTGTVPKETDYPKNIAGIFEEGRAKKADYMFQVFLYSAMLCENEKYKNCTVLPTLLFAVAPDKHKEFTNFKKDKEEFLAEFANKLEELFDENVPFSKCKEESNCKYCNYAGICGR